MAKTVRVVRDDAYEEMGAAYQRVLTAALDAALRESGVKSAATRRKVAESFVFALGEFHDSGWLRPAEGAAPVYPVLCFTERFLNVDTPPSALGTVYAPSPGFAFHEYAHGSVEAFHAGDPAAQIETGSFGGEG
ncbi:hypothetical protein [Fimbriiglobus ruber]|uniref:Uncharacterized protein n=1 Tax=Fimbriiglobus ruber TaxID=1908690 RepID=A0A225DIW9_9BACT|nr:hypothetical protein [Fimbriiglobus ruber]OWK38518.1 hypothetical protein FRUB_07638 [Fimbriiglobus ruber]